MTSSAKNASSSPAPLDRSSWKRVRLGDCATLFAGGTPNRTRSEYYDGMIPWCSISDISEAGKFLTNTKECLSELGIQNSSAKIFPAETLLFAMYASIGKCALTRFPISTSQAILGIYDLKGVDREFLYYYLCSQQDALISQGQTGTQSNLSKEIVSEIEIPLPPLPIQRRIAASLSAVDGHLASLGELMAKHEAIKKSTVSLLLQPRPDWQKVRLGEVFEEHRNNTCSRALTQSEGGRVKNIHYGDILVKYGEIVSLERDEVDFLTEEGEMHSAKDFLQDGDIIVADTAEDETAGKMVEVRDVRNMKVVSGLHTLFYRPPENTFAKGWLGYWMNSKYYHDQLIPFMTGIKVLSLSRQSMSETFVCYPPLSEQRRIVTALSSLDGQLSSLAAEREKLVSLKRGLLRHFFG